MKRFQLYLLIILSISLCSFLSGTRNNRPKGYKGKPFSDEFHRSGAQVIPGKVQCALYDLGGEGIAYHDGDSINNGSGPYNHQPGHCEPGAEYVAYFRINEGVDLSYTKEKLDFSHPNPFTPERRQQFIGWTRDGEWCNYTVNVKKAGTYKVGLLYSNDIKSFKLSLNGKPAGEYLVPLKTGSFHKWNYGADLGQIVFPKAGINLVTLHISAGMNYA